MNSKGNNFFWGHRVGTWEHLELISAVTVTFVLGTFAHISHTSALTDSILTNLMGLNFLGASISVDQILFLTKLLVYPLPTTTTQTQYQQYLHCYYLSCF